MSTLESEGQLLQRIDFESSEPVPSEWIGFQLLRSVLAAVWQLHRGDRAAKRSHGLGRASGQLLGRWAHLPSAVRPRLQSQ